MVDAVRLLQAANLRLEQLRQGIRDRLAGIDRGEGIELEDDEALEKFFDQLEAEANAELAAET